MVTTFEEMKMYQFNKRQQGFTLLELLVVITLLAIISVGALVAYEGIGENAADAAAANNIKTADSSIRAYRAVENKYPNQWDNLANLGGELTGGAFSVLADATKEFFGRVTLTTGDGTTATDAILRSLQEVGVNELQTLTTAAVRPAGLAPNEFFNESAPGVNVPANEVEWEWEDGAWDEDPGTFAISVVTSGGNAADGAAGNCTIAGATGNLAENFNGVAEVGAGGVGASRKLNRINDALDSDVCHAVIAVGFGKDVPGTTLGSRVAISTAPTYTNGDVINPSQHYARYVALFHVGSDDDEDGIIQAGEVLSKARLLAVVDTEGRNIDTAIAGAFAQN
jgi:prepilin-type N-terminal cleavage/methylation domain-containing protein